MPKLLRLAVRFLEEAALWLLGGFLMWLGLDPESFFGWLLEPSVNGIGAFLSTNHARWLFLLAAIGTIEVASAVSIKRHRSHPYDQSAISTHSNASERPDYAAWALIRELKLWQASCLWAGIEPNKDVPAGRPRLYLTRMQNAIIKRQLHPIVNRHLLFGAEISWSISGILRTDEVSSEIVVSRNELARYAKAIGERPMFLFKRRWWLLWIGSTLR